MKQKLEQLTVPMNIITAQAIAGKLSNPSKMPSFSYGFPSSTCETGNKLKKIKGTICNQCYANRGHYRCTNVEKSYQNRYELSMLAHKEGRDQEWVEAMVYLINAFGVRHFRWMDSGDIQGEWMLKNICEVAKKTPYVLHWLATTERQFVKQFFDNGNKEPENLVIRVSSIKVNEPDISFAQKYKVNASGVHQKNYTCPSSKQGNVCGECRKCWDKNELIVIYKKH